MKEKIAICWMSGLIEFTDKVPSGALMIGRGEETKLRQVIGVIARHGYNGQLLAPGIPEAETAEAKVDALIEFQSQFNKRAMRAEVTE